MNPLADAQRDEFLTELAGGASVTHAARKANTSKARIGKIVAAAAAAETSVIEGERAQDQLTEFEVWAIAFFVDMQTATGALEQRLIDLVVAKAEGPKGDWRAAAWMLERLFPERWAKRQIDTKKPPPGQTNNFLMLPNAESLMAEAKRMADEALRGELEGQRRELPPGESTVIDLDDVAPSIRSAVDAEVDESLFDTAGI